MKRLFRNFGIAFLIAISVYFWVIVSIFVFDGSKFCLGTPHDNNLDGVYENCFISE